MQRTHYSGHLRIANIFLRSRLTSSLRSGLSLMDRPNTGYHKTNLPQENYILFEIMTQALFQLLFLFCQSSLQPLCGLFRPIKTKPCRNFKSITTNTVHTFSSDFKFQVTMWRERYNETTSKCFVAHNLPLLLYHNLLGVSQRSHSCQLCYFVLSYQTNINQEAGSILSCTHSTPS